MAIKTLVLLPGMDGTGELFADLVRALPTTLTVKVVRYPTQEPLSHGELLNHVRDAVPSTESFVLLAESFSTPIGVRLAAMHPPNLAGLIICAGFVSSPFKRWGFLIKLLVRPFLFRWSPPDFLFERYAVGQKAPRDLILEFRRVLRLVSPRILSRRVRETAGCDVTEDLTQVSVPIAYLQGSDDNLVSSKCFEEIKQLQPSAILISIPAPHLILQREPQQAADAIMGFVGQLEGRQVPSPRRI